MSPPPQVILQSDNGEREPLLGTSSPSSSNSVSSRKVSPENADPADPRANPESNPNNEAGEELWTSALRYALAMLFVIGVGIAAWFVGGRNGEGGDGEGAGREKDVIEWESQVIGWASAVLYREFSVFILDFGFLPFCLF